MVIMHIQTHLLYYLYCIYVYNYATHQFLVVAGGQLSNLNAI